MVKLIKYFLPVFITLPGLSLDLIGQKTSSNNFYQGRIIESISMSSKILGREVKYSIYFPPDYDLSERRYPVVYLLHGYTDNETAWVQFGEVNLAADRAIASREIPPMIIVMPDAGVTWYINDYTGKVRYEDMFFQEFIPFIDATYRTRPEKESRGVAGLSMGGYGALMYSLRHHDMFSACAAFSAGVITEDEMLSKTEEEFIEKPFYGQIWGCDSINTITGYWKKNNVLDLIKTLTEKQLSEVRYYIDCGDDDFLYKGNSMVHIELRDRNIYHEYRVRDGSHNWTYWRTNITEGLKFIGESFHRY